MKSAKTCLSLILLLLAVVLTNCSVDSPAESKTDNLIFPRGEPGSEKTFTGKAYNFGLVPSDSVYNTLVGNVYFEPGARSNWHKHAGGQILIITDGRGYHQIEEQPRQTMKKGDVIKCPPNARHWHGATENNSLSQLYIVANTEKGIVGWQDPVTDKVYNSN